MCSAIVIAQSSLPSSPNVTHITEADSRMRSVAYRLSAVLEQYLHFTTYWMALDSVDRGGSSRAARMHPLQRDCKGDIQMNALGFRPKTACGACNSSLWSIHMPS